MSDAVEYPVRTKGLPKLLEFRRALGVNGVLRGHPVEEVADVLEVDPRSVRRWYREFRQGGWLALRAGLVPGRPRRLSCTQEKVIGRWLSAPAMEQGFATELWSASRLAQVILQGRRI